MKIHLASDHAGFDHKEQLKKHLQETGYDVIDYGADTIDVTDDYPDFIIPCAKAVAAEDRDLGIVFGGSGQGEAICANKIENIRATVYYGGDKNIIIFSKQHNNANILSIGARFISAQETIEAVDLWLATTFSNDARHIRRLNKVESKS